MNILTKEFANHRGLIRTVLADIMWRLGPYRKYGKVDWSRVTRLVFICQGNICRSPFAHYFTAAAVDDLPVVSFGLATTTGVPANGMALDVAGDYGLDLSDHRTTDISDFNIRDGDLLLVMEDRHIHWLAPHLAQKDVQVGLLGLWCRPRFALLYDPYEHPREYFSSCFGRIERAALNLVQEYRDSRST
jgi:protein-tyrosine phosphatase